MTTHRRKNIRLKGFDYSKSGAYFVTICIKDRACILGDVVDGVMTLSDTGRIVETCWKEIPAHFPNTRVDVFQVMPNHVHGIIEIKEKPCRGEVASPLKGDKTSPLRDSDNPNVYKTLIDDLRRSLKERHRLDEYAIMHLIDCELNYREWQEVELDGRMRNEIQGNPGISVR